MDIDIVSETFKPWGIAGGWCWLWFYLNQLAFSSQTLSILSFSPSTSFVAFFCLKILWNNHVSSRTNLPKWATSLSLLVPGWFLLALSMACLTPLSKGQAPEHKETQQDLQDGFYFYHLRREITYLVHQIFKSCSKCIFASVLPLSTVSHFHIPSLVSPLIFFSPFQWWSLHCFPHSRCCLIPATNFSHLWTLSITFSSSLVFARTSSPLPLSSFFLMMMDGPYGWVGCDKDWPWKGRKWEVCVCVVVVGGGAWNKGRIAYAERSSRPSKAVTGGADEDSKTGSKNDDEWRRMDDKDHVCRPGGGFLLKLGVNWPCPVPEALDPVMGCTRQ